MAVLALEIDNVKKEKEKTNESLKQLYTKLGSIACNYHKAIDCPESQNSFENICKLVEQRDETSAHLDAVKSAVETLNGSDKEIEKSKFSMKNLDEKLDTYYSSLGAICSEIKNANAIPSSLEHCMAPLDEFYKQQQEIKDSIYALNKKPSIISSVLLKNKLKKHENTLNEVFLATGKAVFYSNKGRCLPGDRAQAVLDSIEEIKSLKKNYKIVIRDSKNAIAEAEGSLLNENNTVKDLTSSLEKICSKLNEQFLNYGEAISKTMDSWLDDLAPDDLKNVCDKIKNEKRHLLRLNLSLEFFDLDKQLDLHVKQIEVYDNQIRNLENQKSFIEKQLEDLNKKVDSENALLDVLRHRKSDLEKKA